MRPSEILMLIGLLGMPVWSGAAQIMPMVFLHANVADSGGDTVIGDGAVLTSTQKQWLQTLLVYSYPIEAKEHRVWPLAQPLTSQDVQVFEEQDRLTRHLNPTVAERQAELNTKVDRLLNLNDKPASITSKETMAQLMTSPEFMKWVGPSVMTALGATQALIDYPDPIQGSEKNYLDFRKSLGPLRDAIQARFDLKTFQNLTAI